MFIAYIGIGSITYNIHNTGYETVSRDWKLYNIGTINSKLGYSRFYVQHNKIIQ